MVYLPDIAVRATPSSGATITKFIIYDNNAAIYASTKGQTGVDFYHGAVYNGGRDVVVKAWDTAGNLHQAKSA